MESCDCGQCSDHAIVSIVIHFIQTNEAALEELPHLLAGRDPQSPSDNEVGSHSYNRPARVVIFGRGYAMEDIETFRSACAGSAEEPVAWIVGDPAKEPAPGAAPPGDGYAKIAADITKSIISQWKESGASKDEVFLY